MDRRLKKNYWSIKRIGTYAGSLVLIMFVAYQFLFADRRSRLKIERNKITISDVRRGAFKEYIPQTGIVEPSRQVFLDALEGGNIKKISRESGAMLKKGDEILTLINVNRELQVLQQEASFNESINSGRQTRVTLMRNDLDQKAELSLIKNQLAILEPQYRRQKQLYEKNLIAKQEFERTEADYRWNLERRRITYELYKSDSADRVRALDATIQSERRMMKSLEGVSRIMDNMVVRSPIDGQLSMAHWELGQAIAQGQRLGQVDIVGQYKVRVPIDELYLPRISTGLMATTDFAGKTYDLKISYVYPNITNGRFEVDMNFDGEPPQGIRRGQSLRLRIELGQSSEELLLPMGGFYKDTGGNWVYILDGDNQAVRRDIKLGRKMGSEYFEVLEGLKPGDKVITSSYENFGTNEVLILD